MSDWTAADVVKTIFTAVGVIREAVEAGVPPADVLQDLRVMARDYAAVDDDVDAAARGRRGPGDAS